MFLLKRKSFHFQKKFSWTLRMWFWLSSSNNLTKANFYNMELAIESSFTNAFLCKVQQLPKKKENNQCKSNTRKQQYHSKKDAIITAKTNTLAYCKHSRYLIKKDYEKQSITKLVMIEFGMKLKSFSFSKLSSIGKMYDTENKKIDEKPQVNYIHNQRDDICDVFIAIKIFSKYYRDGINNKTFFYVKDEKSIRLGGNNVYNNLSKTNVKIHQSKFNEKRDRQKKDMSPQLRSMAETLQRRILKLKEESITTITDSENFAQLDEQNENNIVTKKHHEPAPSHIFSSEFVNKAALDQIAKGYSTTYNRQLADFDSTPVDNNDMNQPSMVWQVQDCKRNHNDGPYYSTTRSYVVGVELN
ncbi:hypothetical protein RFI_31373 [Reticulomyxa filosa]|uniref:Uncharacterized protein n=1 Tax=Reticulomyxa filosa TaxID=46433 RepID=X6LVR3_RETFI|nr:hypothetical protein RFI_31373 [Reticulomyxa filosa]|eukprot:ETO06023.1 hypothetical protein RFI_31373 [Reticulomyxa filosa]